MYIGFNKILEAVPTVGSLVVCHFAAGDIDGDISGDIIKHIVSERWRNSSLCDNFGQSCTAIKSIIANRRDGIGNGDGSQVCVSCESIISNGSNGVRNNRCPTACNKSVVICLNNSIAVIPTVEVCISGGN